MSCKKVDFQIALLSKKIIAHRSNWVGEWKRELSVHHTYHSAATHNYIRGGTPSNGFQSGTLRTSLVCNIVKMRKVLDQNPLLGVPLMLRHCGGGGVKLLDRPDDGTLWWKRTTETMEKLTNKEKTSTSTSFSKFLYQFHTYDMTL